MKYIFNTKKAIKNGANGDWVNECDGHEVKDGNICGTPYVCCAANIEAWCDAVPENKIVITTDGKTTSARLYDGDKVVKKATVECSPFDDYDFATGAKIAFDRLFCEKQIVGAIYEVIGNGSGDLHHGFKIGEKVKLIQKDNYRNKSFFRSTKNGLHQFVSMKDVKLVENAETDKKYYNGKVVCVSKTNPKYAYTVGKIYEVKDGKLQNDNGYTMPRIISINSIDELNKEFTKYAQFIEIKE